LGCFFWAVGVLLGVFCVGVAVVFLRGGQLKKKKKKGGLGEKYTGCFCLVVGRVLGGGGFGFGGSSGGWG